MSMRVGTVLGSLPLRSRARSKRGHPPTHATRPCSAAAVAHAPGGTLRLTLRVRSDTVYVYLHHHLTSGGPPIPSRCQTPASLVVPSCLGFAFAHPPSSAQSHAAKSLPEASAHVAVLAATPAPAQPDAAPERRQQPSRVVTIRTAVVCAAAVRRSKTSVATNRVQRADGLLHRAARLL